ncbi:MAG: S8 family serine peptidase [Gemmatimonadota bacterium]|nr:MAG: S8 family serine peptidase [Gemmatimonadota bacterium]
MQIDCSLLSRVVLAGALVALVACDQDTTGPRGELSAPSFRRQQATGAGRHLLLARGSLSGDFRERVEALGGTIERRHDEIGVVKLSGLTEDAAQNLIARSDVEGVFPDVSLQMAPDVLSTPLTGASESDPTQAKFYDLQWHLPTIDADDAWESSNRGAGALVCILDSGADTDHPDLDGRVDLDKSTSFVTGEDLEDFLNHGTLVAAIVSSNGIKVASVAPEATLCIVKVMDVLGGVDFSNLIAGILHAANVGADIINMSLGGHVTSKGSESGAIHALQLAINYANSKGTLLVAAAGNNGLNLDRDRNDMRHIPSQLPHVLSVGATTRENELWINSNYGRTGLDLVAPGEYVVSACDFMHSSSGACYGHGTSFATPQAAGAAAVVFSELGHNTEGSQLGHCVTVGATRLSSNGRDPYFGKGLVNVLGAAACRRPN